MALEIERKFLVVDASWRAGVRARRRIQDHLIARFEGGKARIRFCDDKPLLTIKGPRKGLTRNEYHLELTQSDAEAMIADFSNGPGLEKIRHEVSHQGLAWQIDEYLGPLCGLVTADVELDHEDQLIDLPVWAGREMTGDVRLSAAVLAEALQDPNGAAQVITLYGVDADRDRAQAGA